MRRALGCTEPGIIALACAKAARIACGKVREIEVSVNSGIYKNAYSCGIPGTDLTGNKYAAALGALAGDPDKGLMSLEGISKDSVSEAAELLAGDNVKIVLNDISPRIYVDAIVYTTESKGHVRIEGDHTFYSLMERDDNVLFERAYEEESVEESDMTSMTFDEMHMYADSVPYEKISFIEEALEVNSRLVSEGLSWNRCTVTKALKQSGYSNAVINTSAAIEARFLGAASPAMSITGSGAHGIICTVPLIAEADDRNIGKERLVRSIALNYLVTMYVKECSGKLSAFCGCGVAGGLGLAYALPFLRRESKDISQKAFFNMASSITGMICTGGNQACAMKGIAAVEAAYTAARIAEAGAAVEQPTGILAPSIEETAWNVGRIADPGMIATDKTIIGILRGKDLPENEYII